MRAHAAARAGGLVVMPILGILDGANFVFHEGGHVLVVPFGQFLHVVGGSLTQVASPSTSPTPGPAPCRCSPSTCAACS